MSHYIARSECYIISAIKRSLGQDNVFTPACHSVHRGQALHSGGWVCIQEGGLHPGAGLHPGRSASRRGWVDPTYLILRDTVNERAVRIVVECILVIIST